MALLNNFIRRILGASSFPRYRVPASQVEPQIYQPPPQTKVTSVPPSPVPPPI